MMKLHLIQQILESTDEAVLQAAARALQQGQEESKPSESEGMNTTGRQKTETDKLQEEIDAAFNPWLGIRPPGKE